MRLWLVGLGAGLLTLALPMLPVLGYAVYAGVAAVGCGLLLAPRLLVISGFLLGLLIPRGTLKT